MPFELVFKSPHHSRPYHAHLHLVRETATGRLLLHERPWSFFWTVDGQATVLARGGAVAASEDGEIRERVLRVFKELHGERLTIKWVENPPRKMEMKEVKMEAAPPQMNPTGELERAWAEDGF